MSFKVLDVKATILFAFDKTIPVIKIDLFSLLSYHKKFLLIVFILFLTLQIKGKKTWHM